MSDIGSVTWNQTRRKVRSGNILDCPIVPILAHPSSVGDPFFFPQTNAATFFHNPSADPFGIAAADRKESYQTIFKNFWCAPAAPSAHTLLEYVLDLFEAQFIASELYMAIEISPEPWWTILLPTWRVLGYLDDVLGDSGELVVQLTEDLFDAPAIRLEEHHTAAIVANAELEYIPTPPDTDMTEILKCQKVFFLPFNMVPWFIGKGRTPQQVFLLLHPHLEAHSMPDKCQPILDTLQVSRIHATIDHLNNVYITAHKTILEWNQPCDSSTNLLKGC
eukprot:jgi/Psemu1/21902/gm1.21902_g